MYSVSPRYSKMGRLGFLRAIRNWTCFGGFATSGRRSFEIPQDVLIEADRLRQLKKRRASDAEHRNNSPPLAACFALANLRSLSKADLEQLMSAIMPGRRNVDGPKGNNALVAPSGGKHSGRCRRTARRAAPVRC